jgi:hypothetical protein
MVNAYNQIDENGWTGKPTFASHVKLTSKKPVMNLEEIEHHLQNVHCGGGRMKLDFVDTSSARDAFHSCHDEDGGLVITSHNLCNSDGERAVYRYVYARPSLITYSRLTGLMMFPSPTTEKHSSCQSPSLSGKTPLIE